MLFTAAASITMTIASAVTITATSLANEHFATIFADVITIAKITNNNTTNTATTTTIAVVVERLVFLDLYYYCLGLRISR